MPSILLKLFYLVILSSISTKADEMYLIAKRIDGLSGIVFNYIFGSRSIYSNGWKAGAAHHPDFIDFTTAQTAGKTLAAANYDADVWELYNLNDDFNERIDLAKTNPAKLKELKVLFEATAKKNNVYPFIDWDDVLKRRIHNPKKTAPVAATSSK